LHVNHDICIFDIRRKGLSLCQFVRFALTMQLDPIPSHAEDLYPVTVKGVGGRLVDGFDMDS
jgi:hypothetical protein